MNTPERHCSVYPNQKTDTNTQFHLCTANPFWSAPQFLFDTLKKMSFFSQTETCTTTPNNTRREKRRQICAVNCTP
uniref:Uncharacterized protein n=1 Tax=viral metagenome TaxID=1070528 RepID=A0A6C0BNL5_9ZZZZ